MSSMGQKEDKNRPWKDLSEVPRLRQSPRFRSRPENKEFPQGSNLSKEAIGKLKNLPKGQDSDDQVAMDDSRRTEFAEYNFDLAQLQEHKKYLEQKYDSKNKHGCIWTCSKCNQGFKSKSGLSIHYNYCVGSKELFLKLNFKTYTGGRPFRNTPFSQHCPLFATLF